VDHLTRLIEAALFSADRPLSWRELRALEPTASKEAVEESVVRLKEQYEQGEHGVEVVELADGYQVLTRPELAEALIQARITTRPRKLSTAALETLAVIAYRQPVGRSEVEDIRGVAADGVLRSLQERGLIDVAGRGEGLGRPLLYGTTPRFLELLGLKDLSELPRLEELAVALKPLASLAPELGLIDLQEPADDE
jgi:segregation and condensation protein B